jgi:hypothetical protein
MLKALGLVAAGLVAGFASAFIFRGDDAVTPGEAPRPAALERGAVTAAGDAAARLDELEAELEREAAERAALATEVAALAAELEALRDAAFAAEAQRTTESVASDRAAPARSEPPPLERGRGEAAERQVERLIAGGFTPERAQWIGRRSQELRMATVQARYDALRAGRDPDAAVAGVEGTLRQELGDAEYERYLTALGRPTTVNVFDVLASSPAEQAGLARGDQITSYGGTRVFDIRELTALTLEGTPGEPVVLDVQRDGRTLQLVIPRGPVGIAGGGPFGRRGQ